MNAQKLINRARKIASGKTSNIRSEVGFRILTSKLPPEARRTARIIQQYIKSR